jgi:hypothetical protein
MHVSWTGQMIAALLYLAVGNYLISVTRLIDRINRTRQVLVLLLACILAGGCERDYIMPPAKVRLPRRRVQSLYSEGLCVVTEAKDRRRVYMDAANRLVIPPRYLRADDFCEGMAATALSAPPGIKRPSRALRRSASGYTSSFL